MNEETLRTLVEMQVYLLVTGKYRTVNMHEVPSLDGKGKMSKSKLKKHTVLLHDSLEDIRKKVAKIPSTQENWHVFFRLFWQTASKEEKQLINERTATELIEVMGINFTLTEKLSDISFIETFQQFDARV